MSPKLIAALGASASVLCGAAATAYVFLGQERFPIPAIERFLPGLGETPAPEVTAPQTAAPDAATPQRTAPDAASPQTAATAPPIAEIEEVEDAPGPEVGSAEQPSFDVVRIEPTGEGVIAGRAAPGWRVSVESRGTKVAEVAADEQGEWAVVLDKPLASGGHNLSLKAVSPDGTRAVSSTQGVAAAVTAAPSPAAAPPPQTSATSAPSPSSVAPSDVSPLPRTAAIEQSREAAPHSLPEQDRPGTYTILPGDTLWDIARRYLGSGHRYPVIHRGNRQIIRNPDLIHPEQQVKIPEPSDEQN
jgi:nucleoid-associated protein YgaU